MGNYSNDSADMLTKIKELIEAMEFKAKFKLITKCENQNHVFNIDHIWHIMKSCNKEARWVLQTISSRDAESNMVNFGNGQLALMTELWKDHSGSL